jgi:hypothetical protein
MKKLLGLLSAGLIIGLLSGCGLGPADSPTISIDPIGSIAKGSYAHVTGSVAGGEAITSLSCAILTSTDGVVSSSEISVTWPNPVAGEKTRDFTSTEPIIITVSNSATSGSYKLKVSVTAGSSTDQTFSFTVTGTGGTAATTWTGTMGSNQSNAAGSSIDLDGPTVYTGTASNSHVSEIDLCYSYAAAPYSYDALFSPDQAKLSLYNYTSGWTTTPNSTKFYKTTLTPTQFNAITLKSEITALWSEPGAATPYAQCTADDVFIAKTEQNAIVLILITAQTAGSGGTITLKTAK